MKEREGRSRFVTKHSSSSERDHPLLFVFFRDSAKKKMRCVRARDSLALSTPTRRTAERAAHGERGTRVARTEDALIGHACGRGGHATSELLWLSELWREHERQQAGTHAKLKEHIQHW